MKPHTDRNGTALDKYDRVLIDGTFHASVITVGADNSLLSHSRSDGEPGEEHEWYANDRLTLTHRRRDRATGDEPASVKLY